MLLSRYEGCGNEFYLVYYQDVINENLSKLAYDLCNGPHLVDGLIIFKDYHQELEMIIYNRDGSLASMCGNGIRCFLKFGYDNGYLDKEEYTIKTMSGNVSTSVISYEPFISRVLMMNPIFDNNVIGVKCEVDLLGYDIYYNNHKYTTYSLFLGVPHTIVFVNDLDEATLEIGNYICNYSLFTIKTNVDFVKMLNPHECQIITYERGVGFTKACGTGACATYVICKIIQGTKAFLKLNFPGGVLKVQEINGGIYLEGNARKID